MKHTNLLMSAVAGAALTMAGNAPAAPFFAPDGFSYNEGDLVGQGPWVIRGTVTTPPVTVVSGSLTYAGGGLPTSYGNSVRLQNVNGQDARFTFTPVAPATGNTYYYSAILRWDGTDLGLGSSYIASFLASGASTTTFFRGLLRATVDAGQVYLGTQLAASTQCPISYAPTPITANTPVFVVVKVTEVAGANNDTTELFLFTGGAIPATEPGSSSASASYIISPNTDVDLAVANSGAGLQGFVLRQFLATSASPHPGPWTIDELRGGSTWADVISGSTTVEHWAEMH